MTELSQICHIDDRSLSSNGEWGRELSSEWKWSGLMLKDVNPATMTHFHLRHEAREKIIYAESIV